jgi:dihydrofolate reductase
VQPDGDHGEYSFKRQARSSGLVLGRKTYEGSFGRRSRLDDQTVTGSATSWLSRLL